MSGETEIQWKQSDMIEVLLNQPDDFLKVRETLTRIGVASRKEKRFINLAIFCINKASTISSTSKSCLLLMERILTYHLTTYNAAIVLFNY